MQALNYHVIEFVVGFFLLLSAFSILLWAYLSGYFKNVEAIKYKIYDEEVGDEHEKK